MRNDELGRLALAALLVFGMAVVPALVSARPANQIPVEDVSGQNVNLAKPTAAGWSDVPSVDVPLASAPSGVPDAKATSTAKVHVQVAHDGRRLYVRMRWSDATVDDNVTGIREFTDAAAVQLPSNTSKHPAIAMGSTRTPVNVWYWSADTGTEELLAGGPGTTTRYADPMVDAQTARSNGSWLLVYTRNLTADSANRTSIRMRHDVDVAFAVWNGSNMERSGRKAVSDWYHMPLGPEPSGPPYESLLWGIAGVAIVAVVALTAHAMRGE